MHIGTAIVVAALLYVYAHASREGKRRFLRGVGYLAGALFVGCLLVVGAWVAYYYSVQKPATEKAEREYEQRQEAGRRAEQEADEYQGRLQERRAREEEERKAKEEAARQEAWRALQETERRLLANRDTYKSDTRWLVAAIGTDHAHYSVHLQTMHVGDGAVTFWVKQEGGDAAYLAPITERVSFGCTGAVSTEGVSSRFRWQSTPDSIAENISQWVQRSPWCRGGRKGDAAASSPGVTGEIQRYLETLNGCARKYPAGPLRIDCLNAAVAKERSFLAVLDVFHKGQLCNDDSICCPLAFPFLAEDGKCHTLEFRDAENAVVWSTHTKGTAE